MSEIPLSSVKARIEGHLSLYRRGLLSANEVAEAFAIELIESGCQSHAADMLCLVPGEVSAQVSQLLTALRAADYDWKPFRLGVPEQQSDARFREALRVLDESLSETVPSAEDAVG